MATAYSVHEVLGDGTTTKQYAINFTLGYLDKSHVTAQVPGEVDGTGAQIKRTLTWITDSLVTVDGTAIPNGTAFKIRRETPKTALWHDYSDGAGIVEANLDESNLQNIMLNHEVLDGYGLESAGEAIASAAAAVVSQLAAAASAAQAELWAEEVEDTEVDTGKYSALHWASKASTYAAAVNLPVDIIDDALSLLQVNAGETGYQHITYADLKTALGVILATSLVDGLMTKEDFSKLAGIAANANNYSLPTAAASTLGGIKVGTRLSISSGVLSADSQLTTNSITQTMLNDSIVGQAELKTSSGTVSVYNNSNNVTLPGGAYGFYPRVYASGVQFVTAYVSNALYTTTPVSNLYLSPASLASAYASQTYITASPPYDLGDGEIPLFVFALVDNTTGDVCSLYSAPEAPWHYNGPTDIRTHILDADGNRWQIKRERCKNSEDFENFKCTRKKILLTQSIKNADMPLIPHPFIGTNIKGKTVVLIDPIRNSTFKMREAFEENYSELHNLFYNNKLRIDNSHLNRKVPQGVMCCKTKWKNFNGK